MVKPNVLFPAIEIDPEIKKFVKAEIGDLKAILYNEATKTGVQAREVVDAMILAHPDQNPATSPKQPMACFVILPVKPFSTPKSVPMVARSKKFVPSTSKLASFPAPTAPLSSKEVLLTFSPLLL